MRILFVTTSYPRHVLDPCGLSVYRLATLLAKHGEQVHVLAPHAPGARFDERAGRLSVTRVPYWFPLSQQRLAYGYGILQNIRRNPIVAFQAPFLLKCLGRSLTRLLPHYDLVHAHWLPAALAALRACKACRKPLVVTVRGSDARCLPQLVTRTILARVQEIIVPSIQLQDDLEGLLSRRPLLIPNPVDEEAFATGRRVAGLRRELGIAPHAPVVTFVGRLYAFKDPMTLMRAIPQVLSRHPATQFIFVGDGPLLEELNACVRKWALGSSVRVLGARSDVAEILSISDVFVAISPIENVWSNTITEAMMAGVPCVISDAGYSSRVFHHGADAYLVKAGDHASVAAGIVALLENARLRCRLRDGAFNLLRVWGYNTCQIVHRTLDVYARVLGETPPRLS